MPGPGPLSLDGETEPGEAITADLFKVTPSWRSGQNLNPGAPGATGISPPGRLGQSCFSAVSFHSQ